MGSVSNSLSAGLQTLSGAGLLPANLTPQQSQNVSPAALTETAVADVELTAISSLFGNAAPASDSVSLSDTTTAALFGNPATSSSATTDPILQALDASLTSASNTAATTASSGVATTPPNSGSLFSYIG